MCAEDANQRREILDAAIAMLAEVGYADATLAAVAERAGVSADELSRQFADRPEMLREIVSEFYVGASDYMRAAVEGASSWSDTLRAYVRSNLEYFDTHRAHVIAQSEILLSTPLVRGTLTPLQERRRDAVDILSAFLSAGHRAGEFRVAEPDFVAVALRAGVEAVAELMRADPSVDVMAYAEQLTSIFENGVRR